jgi:hypothetical protein
MWVNAIFFEDVFLTQKTSFLNSKIDSNPVVFHHAIMPIFHKNFLFDGKTIRNEKDTVKEKNGAEGNGTDGGI